MKVLPFTYPEITAFPYHANIFAILRNYNDTLPWFYTYYIQLEYQPTEKGAGRLDFCTAWPTGHIRNCPWLNSSIVSKRFIKKKWCSIIDYIIDCIDDENYILCDVDEYYISHYVRYHKINYQHEIFIYGYDESEKELFVADFFETSNKYQFKRVKFQDFQDAYDSLEHRNMYDNVQGVMSLAYQESGKFYFDLNLVCELMKDYISSKNSNYRYRLIDYRLNDDYLYGITIYDYLIKHIQTLENKDMSVDIKDIRTYHILWEHKKLMSMLIGYLIEQNFLHDCKDILKNYKKEVENIAHDIRNRFIKYGYKFDKESLPIIKEEIVMMRGAELKIIEQLLESF